MDHGISNIKQSVSLARKDEIFSTVIRSTVMRSSNNQMFENREKCVDTPYLLLPNTKYLSHYDKGKKLWKGNQWY